MWGEKNQSVSKKGAGKQIRSKKTGGGKDKNEKSFLE